MYQLISSPTHRLVGSRALCLYVLIMCLFEILLNDSKAMSSLIPALAN